MSQLSPDGRAIVPILDALLTQVRRLADARQDAFALTPDAIDDAPTTAPDAPSDDAPTTTVRKIAHPVPAEAYTTWTEHGLAACRIMDTRTCPEPYNGPCGDRPCARFESDDPAPWLDPPASPAGDEDEQRAARRKSLHNLLDRLDQRCVHTWEEAELLRQHVAAEQHDTNTARAVAAGNKRHVQVMYAELQQAEERARKAERAADLLADSHRRAERAEVERDRYRSAWQSARERAQAHGDGILRIVADRETYQRWLKEAEVAYGKVQAVIERVSALADHWDRDAPPPGNRPLTDLRAALDGTEQPDPEG